jgi:hypothetical protein
MDQRELHPSNGAGAVRGSLQPRHQDSDRCRSLAQQQLDTENLRGLSMPVIADYLNIWHQINSWQLSDSSDQVIWRWTTDGKFTISSAYNALYTASHPIPGCDLIWNTWAPLTVKLFLWLALRRRHWTADRRQRHGLDANDHCFLREQEPETIDHIIVSCSFARQVWWSISNILQQPMTAAPHGTTMEWWLTWRHQWNGEERKGADSIFALVAWEL